MATDSTDSYVQFEENLPPVAGRPGIVQGIYGEVGNLELVVPDPVDGFWVFWFNGGFKDQREGAPIGRWSGGLHIVSGTAMESVDISQVVAGPDFLEAVAVESGRAARLVWSPGCGFVRGTGLATAAVTSAIVESGAALHVLVASGRSVCALRAETDGYPAVDWSETAFVAEGPADAVALAADPVARGSLLAAIISDGRLRIRRSGVDGWSGEATASAEWTSVAIAAGATPSGMTMLFVGLTSCGVVQVGGWSPDDESPTGWRASDLAIGRADAVAACWSSLDGGMVEIVSRHGSKLVHSRFSPASGSLRTTAVVSSTWAPARPFTLRRTVALS